MALLKAARIWPLAFLRALGDRTEETDRLRAGIRNLDTCDFRRQPEAQQGGLERVGVRPLKGALFRVSEVLQSRRDEGNLRIDLSQPGFRCFQAFVIVGAPLYDRERREVCSCRVELLLVLREFGLRPRANIVGGLQDDFAVVRVERNDRCDLAGQLRPALRGFATLILGVTLSLVVFLDPFGQRPSTG